MAKVLEMTFKTDQDKEVTYNLSDPKSDLTKLQANTAMQSMIDKAVFSNNSGELSAIKTAKVKETIITELV